MGLMSWLKGGVGEIMGSFAHKVMLDKSIYREINNVTIPTANGTTQIDHVIVSRYGIFVVETKNMDGWIFGDEKNPQWTQSLFGKKFKFQKPKSKDKLAHLGIEAPTRSSLSYANDHVPQHLTAKVFCPKIKIPCKYAGFFEYENSHLV